ELGERAARWLAGARAAGVFVDGTQFGNDDVMVTVCPWWDGPDTSTLVDRQLEADSALVGDRLWIWAYHAPPVASPTSWTGKRHYGEEELAGRIARHRPGIVLCGHVHQAPLADDGGWLDRIGPTAVLKRRPADRAGANADRARHRDRVGAVVVAQGRRGSLADRGLVASTRDQGRGRTRARDARP